MSIRTAVVRGSSRISLLSFCVAGFLGSACSMREAKPNDSTNTHGAAAGSVAGGETTSGTALVPVRGTIAFAGDTALDVTSPTGAQHIGIVAPLRVYTSAPSDLAHVTPNSFVGITSIQQSDGSQRATEIHIFPEELRGTGEGSRLMAETAAGGRSTMTNGAVSPSRMTNGSVGAGSRMTNGAVGNTGNGTTFTVRYQGGEQTIQIPPGVTVTAIAPTQSKPAAGVDVVVLAHRDSTGRLNTSAILLTGSGGAK